MMTSRVEKERTLFDLIEGYEREIARSQEICDLTCEAESKMDDVIQAFDKLEAMGVLTWKPNVIGRLWDCVCSMAPWMKKEKNREHYLIVSCKRNAADRHDVHEALAVLEAALDWFKQQDDPDLDVRLEIQLTQDAIRALRGEYGS